MMAMEMNMDDKDMDIILDVNDKDMDEILDMNDKDMDEILNVNDQDIEIIPDDNKKFAQEVDGNDNREDIAVALDRVMRLMRRGRVRKGKGRAAGRVMRTLFEEGPMVTRDLAKLLDVRIASLNETLIKLEEEGLIRRFRSEMDGRVHMVQLSTKGTERAERIRRDRRSREKMMASYLTEEERKEFVRLANKIAEGLEQIQKIEDQVDEELKKNSVNVEMARREQDVRTSIIERFWGETLRSGNMESSDYEQLLKIVIENSDYE